MIANGTLYQPSNFDDGIWFMSKFCDQCIHQNPDPDPQHTKRKSCEICMRTMAYNLSEPNYPREWCYENGNPVCTAFVEWDWSVKGDPDNPDNPYAPVFIDPCQLSLFPHIDIAEKLAGKRNEKSNFYNPVV